MTVLHALRQFALKAGLDVQRAEATSAARITSFLRNRGVDCVLDIGANRGQYGRELRRFGYSGHIRSFEPLPDAYSSLVSAASRDPRWSTWRFALGPEEGTALLNVAGNEAAASSSVLPMLPRHENAAPEVKYVEAIEVPMRRLDSLWEEIVRTEAVPFIKVDVQGFEGGVLDGATESLHRTTGLQLEISLVPLYQGGLSPREVFERMDDLGMHLVYVQPGFFDPNTGELLQMDGIFFRPDPGRSA
jgi:FkbM family methyltransferase